MIKLLKNLSKKNLLFISISTVLIVIQVYLELKIPDYMAQITMLVQTEGSSIKDVLIQGSWMILCALGSLASAFVVTYLVANISGSFAKLIRKKLFNKVENFSNKEINKFSTSSLITRATNDITQIQMIIVMGLQLLIKSPIMVVWAVTKILNKGFEWSLLTGICVIFLLFTISIIMIIVLPKFKKIQKLIDNINDVTRENLKGIRVVKAFNAESYQENKFQKANIELTNNNLFTQRAMATLMPVMSIMLYGLTLGIYFIGAFLIRDAMISERLTIFSNMIVFSSYAMQVIMSFMMLTMIFILYPRAAVSAKRINEVLEEELTIQDGNIVENKTGLKSTVEFSSVSFKYEDSEEEVLKDISFKINKGETLAIIGSTGCGKTTLVQLIPRLFDVTKGSILVNGVNVKDYKQEYLHNLIGYIPQKAVLFSGTVNSNVDYGDSKKQIDKTTIKKALKVAQATDFVEALDSKYESQISQGGTNLSGGQKQRLSIARAIARDPEIYIFDDSFSALDYKTDVTLRTELRKHTKDATIIIVAQRVGTVMNSTKIMVLEEGKCVGFGTHTELYKNCKIYKEIALSQLSKEELENAK